MTRAAIVGSSMPEMPRVRKHHGDVVVVATVFALPSYTLLLAVMPVTVSAAAVISAVVVGCVSE